MSSPKTRDSVKPSDPIPISTSHHQRSRSMSMSSSSSSASSYSPLQTPITPAQSNGTFPTVSPSSSPVLSYFLSQSPSKSPTSATFPYRRFSSVAQPPVFEEEEKSHVPELPATAHARRASVTAAGRFAPSNNSGPIPEANLDRGTAVLRRLSLGGGFSKQRPSPPSPPPNSAVTPTAESQPFANRPRRSATLSAATRPKRAPSPMGERILKGHFDGFN